MSKASIGAKIVLEGEKEYRQAITEINKAQSVLKSELKAVTAEFADNANTVDALKARNEVLLKQQEEQEKKLQVLRGALESANKQYGENSKQSQDWQIKLNNAYADLSKLNNEISSNQDALEKAINPVDDYSKAITSAENEITLLSSEMKKASAEFDGNANSMEALTSKSELLGKQYDAHKNKVELVRKAMEDAKQTYGENSDEVKAWQTKLNNAESDLSKLDNELKINDTYLNEAKESTDGTAKSIDNYGKELQEAKEDTLKFGDVLKANLASTAITRGIDGIGSAISSLASNTVGFAKDSSKAMNDLAAKTGVTGEEMEGLQDVMNDIYADNFGENIDDIADSMATVKQQTGLANDQLKETTEQALMLRDTFDMEVNESVRSAKMMMDQFGLSSKDAYNLIAQGAQQGLDKNGDLLDSINEYSVHFKQLGFDAEDMLNMMESGAASGTFSVDKLGDAVKEFGIRVKDGSNTTDEAFKVLNLSSQSMADQFAKGGSAARQALDTTVKKLFEMKDPIKQNTAGVNLFGTMWEDLGAKGIKALMNVNGEISTTKDALDQINQQKYDNLASALSGLSRELQVSIAEPLNDKITPAISDMIAKIRENGPEIANTVGNIVDVAGNAFDLVIEHSDTVIAGIAGIASGMAAFKVGSAIQTGMDLAIKGWKEYKTVTEGATIAQYAINAAQSASPVGLIATAIGAVTTGLVMYKVSSDNAKSATSKLSDELEDAKKANDEYHQSIANSIKARQDNNKSIDTEYGALDKLTDSLYDLSKKENLSNSEKAQMASIVDQLNTALPELNLSIDDQTGLLSMQGNQVKNLITSNLEYAKVVAAQDDLKTIAQEQYDAESRLVELKDKRSDLQDKLNTKLDTYNKVMELEAKGWIFLSDSEKEYIESNKNVLTEAENLSDQLGITNDDITKTSGNITALGNDWNNTQTYIGDHANIVSTGKAVSSLGDTVSQTSDQISSANEEAAKAIDELNKAYKDAVKERTKEIKTAFGLFDEFTLDTKVSGEKLMKNLSSQITGMQNWADNLRSLAKKGVSEGLIKELQEMGPEAASQVAALNKLTEPELEKYNKLWKEKSKIAKKIAINELSDLKEETVKKIDEISKSTEQQLYNTGKNSVDGFIQGFKANMPKANEFTVNKFNGLVADVNNTLGIHSPSVVFEKIAGHTIDGFVQGIKKKKDMAGKSMQELGEEILSKAQQHLDNYKVYHNVSLQDEANYWNEVRKQCKKGTQARVDADKEYLEAVKALKEETKSANEEILTDAQKRLDNYKVYHDTSLQYEVDYWNKIRKEIKKGTQARIDADKEYYEALKSQKEAEKELLQKQVDTEKEYETNIKNIQDNLVNDVTEASKKYSDAVTSRTSAITGAMSLFNSFTPNEANGQDLLSNLQSQVTGLESWKNNLSALKARGISEALLSELEQMGPSASGEIAALNSLSSDELNKYVNLWQEKSRLAREQAVDELSGLKEDTENEIKDLTKQANKELAKYNKEYVKAMQDLLVIVDDPVQKLKTSMLEDGTVIVKNITSSMQKEMESAETQGKLDAVTESIRKSMQKLADISKSIGKSISDNLTSEISNIKIASGAIASINREINTPTNANSYSSAAAINFGSSYNTSDTSTLSSIVSGAIASSFKSLKLSANVETPIYIGRQEFGKTATECILEYDRLSNATPKY